MRIIGVSVKPLPVVVGGPDEQGNATVCMAYDFAENGDLWDYDYLVFPQPWEPGLAEKVAADFEGYKQIGLDYEEEQERKNKEESDYRAQVESAANITFVAMAQSEQLDDITISEHAALFVVWTENWTGKAGTILQDEGALYRSIHDVGPGQNTKPSETPAMWTRIADPAEEWPEWIQPIGAHDAYAMGAKVSHAGKHWTSDVDGNVWEPGVAMWTEAT